MSWVDNLALPELGTSLYNNILGRLPFKNIFEVVFHLKTYLTLSSIYKNIWGRLPFTKVFLSKGPSLKLLDSLLPEVCISNWWSFGKYKSPTSKSWSYPGCTMAHAPFGDLKRSRPSANCSARALRRPMRQILFNSKIKRNWKNQNMLYLPLLCDFNVYWITLKHFMASPFKQF